MFKQLRATGTAMLLVLSVDMDLPSIGNDPDRLLRETGETPILQKNGVGEWFVGLEVCWL